MKAASGRKTGKPGEYRDEGMQQGQVGVLERHARIPIGKPQQVRRMCCHDPANRVKRSFVRFEMRRVFQRKQPVRYVHVQGEEKYDVRPNQLRTVRTQPAGLFLQRVSWHAVTGLEGYKLNRFLRS